MTNIHTLPNDDDMFEQASLWIAKIDRQLTTIEQQTFKKWLAQDIQHQKLMIEMASMWDKMDALNNLADLFPETNSANNSKKTSKLKVWSLSLAASITLALFAGLLSHYNLKTLFDNEQQFVRYQTAVGENSTIYLPDNSKVLLNTDSILLVRYTNDYRLLELKRGELLVEVAHDKSRPLSVVVNSQIIQAVGTAFSVQLSSKKVELIVTEGKVILGQIKPAQKVTAQALQMPNNSLSVSKGELASISLKTNGHNIDKITTINQSRIQESLSWRTGHIVFKGESLADVMKEVSRYTSVKFEIADKELNNIKIAGRFKTGDVAGLIGALNHNFNIKTDRVNKNLVVLRKQG